MGGGRGHPRSLNGGAEKHQRASLGLHMGEFDGAEAIAALGFDRRSQQKAVFGDVNAHIRQFLGSGFLKNGSSKFRQTAV